MALSTELLNTTLEDLRGPLVNAFKTETVVYNELAKRKRVRMEGGTTIDRLHAGAVPAQGIGVFDGGETLPVSRTEISKRLTVEPHRIVAAIPVPKKEMIQNSGKQAAVRIVDQYVPTWVDGFAKDLETYLMTGAASALQAVTTSNLAGLQTFFGPFTAGRNLGVTNGLLAHQTPAAQTAAGLSVQNLARSTAYHYYNQYDDITNFTAHGVLKLRSMQRKLAHWSGRRSKGADLIIMDPELFAVYDESRLNSVRIAMVNDKTENGTQLDFDMLGGKIIANYDIDRANLAGAAADGMATYLNLDFIEWCELQPLTIGKFEDRNDNQDTVTCKVEWFAGWICTKPIAQGVVTGGVA